MVIEELAAYVEPDIYISIYRTARTDTATTQIPQTSKHIDMQDYSKAYSMGCYPVVKSAFKAVL
mgnify:FL=1|jgi:hypothetical protein